MKQYNLLVEKTCDWSVGCGNILDRQLPVSYNYFDPQIENNQYIPFQIESGQNLKQRFNLNYKRPEAFPNGDYCLTFAYKATQSPLLVTEGSSDNKSLTLEFPISDDEQDAKVCASWLTNEVDTVNSFMFMFAKSPLYDIDSHYLIIDDPAEVGTSIDQITLNEGIYINHLAESQFSFPTQTTKFEKPSFEKNSLTISVLAEKIKNLNSNAKLEDTKENVFIYSVQTKWIKLAKNGENLKFGFVQNRTDPQELIQEIELSVYSPLTKVWSGDISVK